jgi:membrane-associated phospholipid phosphatase
MTARDPRNEGFFLRPQRALAAGVALLSLFAMMALVVPVRPLAFEQRWSDWMSEIHAVVPGDVALAFNDLGRGLGLAVVLAPIAVVLIATRRWWALVAFAATESGTQLVSAVVKATVDRPRPPDGLIHPAGASFPSGHTAFAAATCIAVVLLFTIAGMQRRLWSGVALAGIAGMAWSRTYLQVHWPLDVLAGSVLGISIALMAFAVVQLLVANSTMRRGGALERSLSAWCGRAARRRRRA